MGERALDFDQVHDVAHLGQFSNAAAAAKKVIWHPQSIEVSEAVRQSQISGLAANAWNVARLQR
jgi:hypothetical protein